MCADRSSIHYSCKVSVVSILLEFTILTKRKTMSFKLQKDETKEVDVAPTSCPGNSSLILPRIEH
jgi:hypothetical protein